MRGHRAESKGAGHSLIEDVAGLCNDGFACQGSAECYQAASASRSGSVPSVSVSAAMGENKVHENSGTADGHVVSCCACASRDFKPWQPHSSRLFIPILDTMRKSVGGSWWFQGIPLAREEESGESDGAGVNKELYGGNNKANRTNTVPLPGM